MTTLLLGPVGCRGCEAPVELVRFTQVIPIEDDCCAGRGPILLRMADEAWCDTGTETVHRCPRNPVPWVPASVETGELVAVGA